MVKLKKTSSFVCQECGYDTPKFYGKCPECSAWNSFKEIRIESQTSQPGILPTGNIKATPTKLSEIVYKETSRIQTEYAELNTVLGGGIVPGSAILLAGDPGVGKSTLLLQLCLSLAHSDKRVLYISGEESIEQIKMRALRLSSKSNQTETLFLLATTDPDSATQDIAELKPDLIVVDSIQTMQSSNAGGLAGSVGQVRYGALHYIRIAKTLNIPLVLVGHVTKEGMVAGPMVLSHMVDTVLFLEGEKFQTTRLLRSLKNRFGPVDEVGIFSMDENGLQEITNPEMLFLSETRQDVPGTVLVVTMEGTRAFMVEIQALAVFSRLPMPRRVVSGIDPRRVELLLAVLQKHAKISVDTMDVFVNVAGGLKLTDPGIDLGICLAIFSSVKNVPLTKSVGIAEVGLLGELRSVSSIDKRIREAEKLGFKHIITPKTQRTLSGVITSLSLQEPKLQVRNPKNETNNNTK